MLADKCTACDKCVDVCPTKVVLRSDSGEGTGLPWFPVICDLCADDPACTRICPTGAIYLDERKVLK